MTETIFNELPRIFSYTADAGDVIRVVVVDSREAMREGLRQMLNGDESIKVIGEARNGKEALSQIHKLYPDIVILDVDMKGGDGIKMITEIKKSLHNLGIIVLNDDQSYLVPAIESGASAFLTRNIGRIELTSAIRIVYLWRSILFQDDDHFTLVKL
jgi:DNA-binding NarL/FixJ family response regulator